MRHEHRFLGQHVYPCMPIHACIHTLPRTQGCMCRHRRMDLAVCTCIQVTQAATACMRAHPRMHSEAHAWIRMRARPPKCASMHPCMHIHAHAQMLIHVLMHMAHGCVTGGGLRCVKCAGVNLTEWQCFANQISTRNQDHTGFSKSG